MATQVSGEADESWVIGVATVDEALARSSALVRDLVTYLQWLRGRLADDAVRPYMRDRGFDFHRIRQRARASSEPLRFDELELREREAARAAGRDEDGRAYRHRTDRDDDERDRPRIEVLDWDRVRGSLRRAVILADPGMGKSFLLMAEGSRLAEESMAHLSSGQSTDEVPIPTFVRLSVLATRLASEDDDLIDRVVDGLEAERDLRAELLDPDRFFAWLRQRLCSEHGVLLLDALDEVHEGKPVLLSALDRLMQGTVRPRVFLSSRIVGYERPWVSTNTLSDRELEIVVFGPPEIERFISAWFRDDSTGAGRLRAAIRDSREVAGMAGIPLLLSLLCRVADDGGREDIPVRRVELYERVLNDLLAGVWRPRSQRNDPLTVARKLRLLRAVAWHFATASGWRDYLPLGELDDVLRRASQEAGLGGDQLRELSEEDGILVRAGADYDRQVPYLFLHRTFHEYLVASYLRETEDADLRVRVIAGEWDNPDWAEVLSLYAGLCDGDADRLDELFGTILDPANHEPDLDPVLCRPEWTYLRLAGECSEIRGTVFDARIRLWIRDELAPAVRNSTAAPSSDPRQAALEACWPHNANACAAALLREPSLVNAFLQALDADLLEGDAAHVARVLRAHLQHPRVQSRILDCLQRGDSDLRRAAVSTFGPYAEFSGELRPAFLTCLADHDFMVREACVTAIASWTDSRLVTHALIAQLEDESWSVVEVTAKALTSYVADPGIVASLVERLAHPRAQVRAGAVRTLSEYPVDSVVIGALLDRLDDDDVTVRVLAVESLKGLLFDSGLLHIVLTLAHHEDRLMRWAAIRVLSAHVTDRRTEVALRASLKDEYWRIRVAAIEAILHRAPDEFGLIQELVELTADSNILVQEEAANVLGRIPWNSSIASALIPRLKVDADSYSVFSSVVRALSRWVAEPDIRAAFLGILASGALAPLHRQCVLRYLSTEAGDAEVHAALVASLDDPDRHVRRYAAEALSGSTAGSGTIPTLLSHLEDSDRGVRSAVGHALMVIRRRSPASADFG